MVESWLFIGNPGAGKSTLINCLAGRVVFASGLSYGGGLTRTTQTCVDGARGIVYTDTPGLADGVAERSAADAITGALRSSGSRVKLIFVVRLLAGTVVGQDLVTIERVLDSIRIWNVSFGIIINCVSKRVCRNVVSDPSESKRLIALVNSGKYMTPHILVFPEIDFLIEASNRIVELPHGTRCALERFPTTSIPSRNVSSIFVEGFPASVELMKRSVSALAKDKRRMQDKQQELAWKQPEFWKTAIGIVGAIVQVALSC